VEEIDWSVGRLMATLRETGADDNTLVFFTSDNGPWFEGSAGPYRGRKGQSYEGGFHVPMIARWPAGLPAGTECQEPWMNIDLYPTILSLAGVPLPEDRIVDGRNILDLIAGRESQSPHDALFFYHFDQLEGIRVGQWKYFRRLNRYVWPIPLDAAPYPTNWAAVNWEIAGRCSIIWPIDPGESYNVIDTHPEVAEKLEKALQQWEAEAEKNPGGWL
jgi:arylsulfatase A